MRRELQPKSAATRRMVAAKPRRPANKPEPDEFPLAHDAANWDEDTFQSGWDDDEALLADELARFADD